MSTSSIYLTTPLARDAPLQDRWSLLKYKPVFVIDCRLIRNTSTAPAKDVATAFSNMCSRNPFLQGSLRCSSVQAMIANSANASVGRRAALMCVALNQCKTSVTGCNLLIRSISSGNLSVVPLQQLDQCSADGIPLEWGGYRTSSYVGSLDPPPSGYCVSAAQCSADGSYDCNMASLTQQCSCNSSSGDVACKTFGTCQKSACGGCNDCVNAVVAEFTSKAVAIKDVATVASSFYTNCTSALNDTVTCDFVRQQILKSLNGSVGRRPGAICNMLQLCGTSLVGKCDIKLATKVAKFDLCR